MAFSEEHPMTESEQDARADDESPSPYDVMRGHFETDALTDDEIDEIADLAVDFIRNILIFFGETHVTVDEYEGDEGELILDVCGGDLAVLIGRHGRTLDALQALVSSYLANKIKFRYPVVVDIEGYKTRRKEKLITLAKSAAARAKRQKGSVRLPPMNAYERRLVHLALVDEQDLNTHSEGVDPERRVVVSYIR